MRIAMPPRPDPHADQGATTGPSPALVAALRRVHGEDGLGILVERQGFRSRKKAIVHALEQGKAELRFQMLDGVADSRLGQAQFLPGPDCGFAADDRSQQFELSQVHISNLNFVLLFYS